MLVRVMLSLPETKPDHFSKIVRNDISYPLQFSSVDEAFKDFKERISETVKDNLDLLNEVPLHTNIPMEEFREYLKGEIEKDLKEDRLFEKSVEISRYSKNMFDLMESYFREIFAFHEERKKALHSDIFDISKVFLNSDLPLQFINTFGDSILAEIDYVGLFDKEIRKERLDLIVNSNNRTKFERICESHNAWVSQFSERRNRMDRQRVKVFWYVDFNNSASVNEIFKDKIIKTSCLKKQVLHNLIQVLQENVVEMEKLNATKMKFFLPCKTDDETKAIVKMMNILSRQQGTT